jgi:vacuolar protein sorting-associated protein 13A/C
MGDTTSVTLRPGQLSPFWPGNNDRVNVSIDGDTGQTTHHQFSLSIISPMVLPMADNQSLPVLTIKIHPDPIKNTTVISFHSYADIGGLLKIENLCRSTSIKFIQSVTSGSGQLYALVPNQSILYPWDSPSDKRELEWLIVGAQERKWNTLTFNQAMQEGSVTSNVIGNDDDDDIDIVTCYWMTVFDGSLLVLRYFDHDDDIKFTKKMREHSDLADFQCFCSLEGVGLSLVNDSPKEVAYCTISSSPTVWKKKHKDEWTMIDVEESALLETAWRAGDTQCVIGDRKYDLNKMVISSKGSTGDDGYVSRSFNPGIWVWSSIYSQRLSIDVRLGHVQIDNQLDNVELPTHVVFSTRNDSVDVSLPFLKFLLTVNSHNDIRDVEECVLHVRPTQLNLELGLVAAILPFSDVLTTKHEVLENDKSLIERSLRDILHIDSLIEVRTVSHINMLQIAQTSVTVNYTTAGDYDLSSQWGKVVDALIHFAFITKGIFDINLKSVSISNEIVDIEQIKRLLWGHYKNEMMFQFQKLALGLDVIGSPHKLFNSFQTGTKDLITLSYQGVTDGEGSNIALGVKSFLGHFIEGSAESGARSTGALSSLLLAATDIEYQRKHRYTRQAINDGDLTSNVKLGSTFFIRGVIHGTTDIIVKPITGASNDGFEGFMKGFGRGTVSVLVKPTLGAIDLAKYIMEGIRSAVDDEFGLETSRLPRLIHCDKIITPYNSHDAEGLYIIHHLSTPLFNEDYMYHEWLPANGKSNASSMVVVVTSKQIMQLRKSRKHYQLEWSTNLENIVKTEALHFVIEDQTEECPGLLLVYKEDKLIRKKEQKFVLKLENTEAAKIIEDKINSARSHLSISNKLHTTSS